MRPICRLLSPVVVIAASATAMACVDLVGAVDGRYIEREEKRFGVAGRADVSVSTFDGSVEVRGWDRPEVLVVVEKHALTRERAAAIQVRAEQSGNRVTIEVPRPTGTRLVFGWHDADSARLIVSVPTTANVTAKSDDGSIVAADIAGDLDLRSRDGSVRGHDLTGALKVHTSDGSIAFDGLEGTADVSTRDGSIRVAGRRRMVRAESGDGSVHVRAAPGSAADRDWDISTRDGSVSLDLADGFNGELDARTGDGHARLHDFELSNVTGELGKHNIRGRLGSGGRAIRVRTGDGSISIRKF